MARTRLIGRLEQAIENIAAEESGRVSRLADEIRDAAEHGRPLVDEQGLFGLLATPDQREVINKVQALMSLLEGHGHIVMDRIGEAAHPPGGDSLR